MKPILVLYATREGHTRRVAEWLAGRARTRGLPVETINAKQVPAGFSLDNYSAAILAASVHLGRHESEIAKFVKARSAALNGMAAAFLSVSLAEAGAEDKDAPPEGRAHAEAEVKKMIDHFLAKTGWRPVRVLPVAGALSYTKYNFLVKFLMKRIARRAGGSTDTSRDHDYTDWTALDRFEDDFFRAIPQNVSLSAETEPEHR